jgi:hypothetical protein
MRVPPPKFGRQIPKVCLQHDGISSRCACQRLEEHGAVFHLPCRLELMSSLELSMEWCAGCRRCNVRISAIVVGCSAIGDGCFETTVLFVPGGEACGTPEFRHLPN